MKYYVYRITDKTTSKFYIGYRACSTSVNPLDDLGVVYFTSGSLKKVFQEFPRLFDREIINVFETKNDAYCFEQNLIKANYNDAFCVNYFKDTKTKLVKKSSVKVSKDFQKSIKKLSHTQKKRETKAEIKRLVNRQHQLKIEENYIQYCDIETRAIVKVLP